MATFITIKDFINNDAEANDSTGSNSNNEYEPIYRYFPQVLALLFGPSSMCVGLNLGLSYTKTILADILFPVEVGTSFTFYILILSAGMYEDREVA